MQLKPIRNASDHRKALALIEELWDAAPDTDEGDLLDILVDLVEHYEEKHFPISAAEPVDVIKAHMDATGRTQKELGDLFGSAPRASEILKKRRALTVDMIHKLHEDWGIPSDCLIRPYHLEAA